MTRSAENYDALMGQLGSAVDETRVLILGSGFIGAGVSRFLRSQRVDVCVMSRSAATAAHGAYMGDPTVIAGDAGHLDTLVSAFAGRTHVVFAVGSLMPGESEVDPTRDMALLLETVTTTLRALIEHPNISLTFVSSGGTVYGEPAQVPTSEDAPTDPIGAYGIVRLAAEKFVLRHHRLHGNAVRIARLANVYGSGQTAARGQGVIAAALRHAQDGTLMHLFGTGDVRRDFIHIDDAAACLARYTLLPEAPAVLNVGSGRSDSMETVLATVEAVTGRPIKVVHEPARPFDVHRVELDITRLRSLMPFSPRSLRQGIEDTWSPVGASETDLDREPLSVVLRG
jgi:UDP-glucose 4-epimerase